MNFETDKINKGKIRHVFGTDKFERKGLDVIFEKIKFSFKEDDLVGINYISRTETETEINDFAVADRKFDITLEKPTMIKKIEILNTEFPDNLYKVYFEQIEHAKVSLFIHKIGPSPDGNYFDDTTKTHKYYEVIGTYKITITGNETSLNNGVYKVKKDIWEPVPRPETTISNATYVVDCSALSLTDYITIKLPFDSEPAPPIIVPEEINNVKIVEYFYISPDTLLLNVVISTENLSGYIEHTPSSEHTTTVFNNKLDINGKIIDYKLYFEKHEIKQKNMFDYQYNHKRDGTLEIINWKYASVMSTDNVFTDQLPTNDKPTIDNTENYIMNDLIILRKQENNSENGIYRYNGEDFEKITETKEIIDNYYILREGSEKRKGKGVRAIGNDGFCFDTLLTYDKLTVSPIEKVTPTISKNTTTTTTSANAVAYDNGTGLSQNYMEILTNDQEFVNNISYILFGGIALLGIVKMMK